MKTVVAGTLLSGILVAGSAFALSAAKKSTNLSLDELKALCHEKEQNDQIQKFKSTFSCSEERIFWVKKGEKRIPLDNQSIVRIKALVKNDTNQTDWWEVPSPTQTQEAICPVMEQWRTYARVTLPPFTNCAQLDAIVDEKSFCEEKLASVWAECSAERNQASQGGQGLQLPQAPRCEYEATGVVKSCSEDGPVLPTTDQSCQHGSGSKDCSNSSSSSSSSSNGEQALSGLQSQYAIGAALREITVKRNFFIRRYKVVLIDSPVAPGSLVAQMGLKQGDVVSHISDQRTPDIQTFERLLKEAKTRGAKSKIEYMGDASKQKFASKIVAFTPPR